MKLLLGLVSVMFMDAAGHRSVSGALLNAAHEIIFDDFAFKLKL